MATSAASRISAVVLLAIACAALYFPVRREVLDRGWVASGEWQTKTGDRLTLFGNGRYVLRRLGSTSRGRFAIERFPNAPWISMLRLDETERGLILHVRYEERVYRIEDIRHLEGADVEFDRR